jgi:type I restriction enzyme M protein
MMVEVLDPEPDDVIIDPACGSGGFLIDTVKCIWTEIEVRRKALGHGRNIL